MHTNRPFAGVVAIIASFVVGLAQGEAADPVKISTFAPMKDVVSQLDYFVGRIEKDLEDGEEFGEAEQKRVGLDASTVAVLSLMLGMHDEAGDLKKSASKLAELAATLAENSEDHEAASKTLAEIKTAIKNKPEGEPLTWDEPVADLAMLMQQVPIVNDGVRRAVNDKRRFSRNAARNAPRAVTLAAIAQASLMDTTYCGDEEDEKEWKAICADMRDACADVYKALIAKDQDKAKEANARVVKSCDACHDRFR